MIDRRTVDVPVLSAAVRVKGIPLSLVTRCNGFAFVSGLAPLDCETGAIVTGSIQKQTIACLEALKMCLASAGSDLSNVAMVRIYASNAGHYEAINEIYQRYFEEYPPSRTFVVVGSWPGSFDLEIECVAALPT